MPTKKKLLKFSSNYIFRLFLFLSYSFGVKKTNTFTRSRGSLENHTRFQTIMSKICAHFQTKTAQKPYPLGGAHTYIAYVLIGSTPTGPKGFKKHAAHPRANFFRSNLPQACQGRKQNVSLTFQLILHEPVLKTKLPLFTAVFKNLSSEHLKK